MKAYIKSIFEVVEGFEVSLFIPEGIHLNCAINSANNKKRR